MARLTFEVLTGSSAGRVIELDAALVRIGRAPGNELTLDDLHVSGEHARVTLGDGAELEDRGSTNGTWVTRGDERHSLNGERRTLSLATGDVIELGGLGDEGTRLRVSLEAEPDNAQIVSVKPLGELGQLAAGGDAAGLLKQILGSARDIGASEDLEQVVSAVADAALSLVPRATHATVALREEEDDTSSTSLVAVVTRTRGAGGQPGAPSGPVPVTRSVARRVLKERAAVLAADARAKASRASRCSAPASAAPSGCRSGKATTSSACSRSTAAARRPSFNHVTWTRSACSPRAPRWRWPTRA